MEGMLAPQQQQLNQLLTTRKLTENLKFTLKRQENEP
jgi:hypothetical protein